MLNEVVVAETIVCVYEREKVCLCVCVCMSIHRLGKAGEKAKHSSKASLYRPQQT